jgi:hypothetical protein
MSFDMEELEKTIERKISDLEREKSRLKDGLNVVRQASVIANDFEGVQGTPDSEADNSSEERSWM